MGGREDAVAEFIGVRTGVPMQGVRHPTRPNKVVARIWRLRGNEGEAWERKDLRIPGSEGQGEDTITKPSHERPGVAEVP